MLGHNPTFYAEPAEPQSLNKYQYALNNPLRYIDPDGHQSRTADRVVPLPYWMWISPEHAKAIGKWIEDYAKGTADGAKVFAKEILDASGRYVRPCSVMMECQSEFEKQLSRNQDAAATDETPANSNSTQQSSSSSSTPSSPKPRGSRNPNTAKAAAEGRRQHRIFADKVKGKSGWKSETNVRNPGTGKTVRPDAQSRRGKPIELKPNTPSGRKRGAKQLHQQEEATGKKGRVVYYEPKRDRFQ